MRVFITGASGHVGSALVPELLQHGHSVVGLARSDESAARLTDWGADIARGDLDGTRRTWVCSTNWQPSTTSTKAPVLARPERTDSVLRRQPRATR